MAEGMKIKYTNIQKIAFPVLFNHMKFHTQWPHVETAFFLLYTTWNTFFV